MPLYVADRLDGAHLCQNHNLFANITKQAGNYGKRYTCTVAHACMDQMTIRVHGKSILNIRETLAGKKEISK
jgi:hypothetical protein